MSERLEALKTARQRMIEDRDTHVKVLAAPFDPRQGGASTQQIHRDSGADRRTGPRHQRRGSHLAETLSQRGRRHATFRQPLCRPAGRRLSQRMARNPLAAGTIEDGAIKLVMI